MAIPLKLLLIEDDENDALLIVHQLRRGGYEPSWKMVRTAAALEAALREEWDVITCDWVMPQLRAPEALSLLRRRGVEVPILIVSGEVGEEVAVTAMKGGAHDFVSKHKLDRLCPAIERELREAEVRRDHRRALEALRESEDRYRDLVEHSQGLLCTHDLEGVILSVNAAPARALGYSPEELVGLNLRDVLAPEVRDALPAYLASVREEGCAEGLMTVQTKKGKRRVWEYSNTLRTQGVVEPIVRGIAHDVTERVRTARRLHEMAEQRAGILDALPANVALLDTDGVIVTVNQRWIRFAADNGISNAHWAGTSYLAVCDRAQGEGSREAAAAAQGIRGILDGAGSEFSLEYPCHSPDTKRWFRLLAAPLVAGSKEGAVVMHIDMTALRTALDALAADKRANEPRER
jgi:PAS domain S-box-containing protein